MDGITYEMEATSTASEGSLTNIDDSATYDEDGIIEGEYSVEMGEGSATNSDVTMEISGTLPGGTFTDVTIMSTSDSMELIALEEGPYDEDGSDAEYLITIENSSSTEYEQHYDASASWSKVFPGGSLEELEYINFSMTASLDIVMTSENESVYTDTGKYVNDVPEGTTSLVATSTSSYSLNSASSVTSSLYSYSGSNSETDDAEFTFSDVASYQGQSRTGHWESTYDRDRTHSSSSTSSGGTSSSSGSSSSSMSQEGDYGTTTPNSPQRKSGGGDPRRRPKGNQAIGDDGKPIKGTPTKQKNNGDRNWDGEVVGAGRKRLGVLTGDQSGTTGEKMDGGGTLITDTNRVRAANEDWSRTSGDQDFLRRLSSGIPGWGPAFALAFGDEQTQKQALSDAAKDAAFSAGGMVAGKVIGKVVDKFSDGAKAVAKRVDDCAKRVGSGCFVAGTEVAMAPSSDQAVMEAQDATENSPKEDGRGLIAAAIVSVGIAGAKLSRKRRRKRVNDDIIQVSRTNNLEGDSNPNGDVFVPFEEYERDRVTSAYVGDTTTRPCLLTRDFANDSSAELPQRHHCVETRANIHREIPSRWSRVVGTLSLLACTLVSLGMFVYSPRSRVDRLEKHWPASIALNQTPPTKSIETIQVGERVVANHPTGEFDWSMGKDVDRQNWRKLELRAPKNDGTVAEVTLLRPKWWLTQHNASIGGIVEISVPECGIDGRADVLSIKECPEIKSGNGSIVTGTFKHESARVLDIRVEGLCDSLGVTPNHPFWSEDRLEFIPASQLLVGERLRSYDGQRRVVQVNQRIDRTPVYNIEVQGHHVYSVSSAGILVHNTATNVLCDNAIDALKTGKRAVVIGRGMARIEAFARKHGFKWYKATKFVNDPAYLWRNVRNNKQWIRDRVKNGDQIFDIGPFKGNPDLGPYYSEEIKFLQEHGFTKGDAIGLVDMGGELVEIFEWVRK